MTKAVTIACVSLTAVVITATVACVVSGIAPYPAAAIMGATGVAAVGVNRSVTGDCWGSCGAHRMCDHDSGMCVPQPCGGECRYDEACEYDKCVLRRKEQAAPGPDVDGGGPPLEDDGGASR